jgi:small nuclear ribonucleoprotein (snRNP)-like protein
VNTDTESLTELKHPTVLRDTPPRSSRMMLVMLAGLLSLGLIALGWVWRARSAVVFPTPYQAVLLSNGSVYYGKLQGYGTSNPYLTNVFYIVSTVNSTTKQTSNTLVKRGKELHGPDRMYLSPTHIVFVETVGTGSKVAQLIAQSQ